MNDMSATPGPGHNIPPVELTKSKLDEFRTEANLWLDGQRVETEGQMQSVDALIADLKAIEKQAKDGKEAEFRPAKKIADDIAAIWNPVLKGIDDDKKGLLGLVSAFKVKLAREQEAKRLEAEREAEEARKAAEMARDATDYSDLDSRKAADEMALEAREAERAAQSFKAPKGLRTRKVARVTDYAAFFKWLQANDKPAVIGWLDEQAQKRLGTSMDGVAPDTEQYAV